MNTALKHHLHDINDNSLFSSDFDESRLRIKTTRKDIKNHQDKRTLA